jgi:hypothetical protein
MSSILIRDLEQNAILDRKTMSSVRGGMIQGPAMPNINVNVGVDQTFAQFQGIAINVLNNNGVIGAGLVGPGIALSPELVAQNAAVFQKHM